MRCFSLAAVFIFTSTSLIAQEINCGPRFTAMANTGVAMQDIWSMQSNQAGLAILRQTSVAAAFQSHFFNSGISTQSLIVAVPYHHNVFALSWQTYGLAEYREHRAALALAKDFGGSVFSALNFSLHQLSINSYGTALAWSFEAGLQYKVADNVILGTHISNPSRNSYEQGASTLPASVEFGATWKSSVNLLLSSAITKNLRGESGLGCGIEYSLEKRFSLRGGIFTNPLQQFAGLGFNRSSLRIDLAVAVHPSLGYSPQVSLGYEF